LTIAQALAFPVPLLLAVCSALSVSESTTPMARRLNLGLAIASLWTAASVMFGPTFSVGYNLFSNPVRYGCAGVHGTTALVAFAAWRQAGGGSISHLIRGCVGSFYALLSPKSSSNNDMDDEPDGENNDSALYSFASLGLLVLAIMPQLVGFPTATIPMLLGKRLSRGAGSGFSLLGAVGAYCLKDASEQQGNEYHNEPAVRIRRGLGIGAAAHLGLVVAKVIGVDGGGLLLPGRGLWKDYPSLVAASGAATALMCVTYAVLAFAALGKQKS
jgi:hypothetical protein